MENTITITRRFSASVSEVWQAWINPELFVRWFGPGESKAYLKKYTVVEGEDYEVDVVEPSGVIHTTTGVFEKVEPEHTLIFTWFIHDLPMDTSRITVTITPTDKGSELVLVQENLSQQFLREVHSMGWESAFTKLTQIIKK